MKIAGLLTGIQLQDNFSNVLYGIMSAVNLAITGIDDMRQSLSAEIDTSGINSARDAINNATAALNTMNEAMGGANHSNLNPNINNSGLNPRVSDNPPIPAQWQSNGMDIFTNTGIDRFRQEVQSANTMLERLSSTQDAIARQAYNTNIFPPEAFQDLNSMATRMNGIRDRIQQIENNPMNMGTDTANAELEQLRVRLNQMVQEQNVLNSAMQNMDVGGANEAYSRLRQLIDETERNIRDNVDEQGNFNQRIRDGTTSANGLLGTIRRIATAYLSIRTVGSIINVSDTLTQTTARIDMMNDGLQTTEDLQNKIFLAAERSRGSFTDLSASVSKLGILAGDAFTSNDEIANFTELLQKQFTVAGASIQESGAAMYQLTQAMAAGKLQGDEFRSIMENAPMLAQAIEDHFRAAGIEGTLKDWSSQGLITADIIKEALFASADDINAKFDSMPMTFGQIWQSFKNNAIMAFRPVLQRLNDIANSKMFQNFVNGAIRAMTLLSNVVLSIFDLIGTVGGFIADNWSIIAPIVYGVIAALTIYYGKLLLVKIASLALALAQGALKLAMMLAVPVYAKVTGATMANTAAQWGLNSAMYACPIVWIIILIIALIAIIYAVIGAINHFAGTTISATGAICGVIAVAVAFIWNQFAMFINAAIDIFAVLWNFIAAFANFFGNVFNDPVGAIARLFFDLVDCILQLLQTLASAIDTLFGSNLAGAVQGWRDDLGGWVDKTFGEGEEIMAKVNGEDWHANRIEYDAAWDFGYSLGEGIDNEIDKFLNGPAGKKGLDPNGAFGERNLSSMENNLNDIAGDTSGISDSLDISNEDLKYIRDLAEREAVNRFTMADVNVTMNNSNSINQSADLDGIIDGLTTKVVEALEVVREGV